MEFKKIEFEQYGRNTEEFLAFTKEFKKQLKAELEKAGAKLEVLTVGHFYLSGFFYKGEQLYYLSWHNGNKRIMYRTAKHLKDFTGGSNQYKEFDKPFNF